MSEAGNASGAGGYEVISISLPRDLVRRTNDLIPRSRRSRVIAAVLESFLDSIARRKVSEAYATYYTERSAGEVREERAMLDEWKPSDAEAWALLERETRPGRRSTR
jgi:hypothetical protein